MTPICSEYDSRIAVLYRTLMMAYEDLAICKDRNPREMLAENLFVAEREVHQMGEERYIHQAWTEYPMLAEAIK